MGRKIQHGDHLVVKRGAINHHGIYIGDGMVVHYTGERFKCQVQEDDLSVFSQGHDMWFFDYDDILNDLAMNFNRGADRDYRYGLTHYHPDSIVERAKSQVGEDWYCIAENNCEHFAHWCVLGESISSQVGGVKGIIQFGVFFAAYLSGGVLSIPAKVLATYFGYYQSDDVRKILEEREARYREYVAIKYR